MLDNGDETALHCNNTIIRNTILARILPLLDAFSDIHCIEWCIGFLLLMDWMCPGKEVVADFVIGGAYKSGLYIWMYCERIEGCPINKRRKKVSKRNLLFSSDEITGTARTPVWPKISKLVKDGLISLKKSIEKAGRFHNLVTESSRGPYSSLKRIFRTDFFEGKVEISPKMSFMDIIDWYWKWHVNPDLKTSARSGEQTKTKKTKKNSFIDASIYQ